MRSSTAFNSCAATIRPFFPIGHPEFARQPSSSARLSYVEHTAERPLTHFRRAPSHLRGLRALHAYRIFLAAGVSSPRELVVVIPELAICTQARCVRNVRFNQPRRNPL